MSSSENDDRNANAFGNVGGNAYRELGDYRKAIDYHKEHLSIAEQIGDLHAQGNGWNNLGVALYYKNLYLDALACYLKARPIRQQIGNPYDIELTESNIADIRTAVGESDYPALLAEAERLAADPNWRPEPPPEDAETESQP